MASRHRLFLMSVGKRSLLEKVKDELFDKPLPDIKCVCIPTAAYGEANHDWLEIELDEFRNFGLSLDIFCIKDKTPNEVAAKLSSADVIYVTGGNTYFLLEHMKKCDFARALTSSLDAGAVYIGTSAGAVVTGPDIGFIEDMDDPKAANLDDYKGLDLVDFYLMPHIDGEYFKDAVKDIAAKADSLDKNLWGLKDNQALLYKNNYIRIIESTLAPEPKLTPEIYVTSYKESLAFYVQTLGFNVLYDRKDEGFAMLEKEGAFFMIDELGGSRDWLSAELSKPYGRGVNFQIEVADVMALYEAAQKADAPIFLEMEEKWYATDIGLTGNKQFIVQDPDGYLLRFYEDLGVKTQ